MATFADAETGISIHPPRVGWDDVPRLPILRYDISIHPPRVGWDFAPLRLSPEALISIHPPRVGWDDELAPYSWN